MFGYLKTFPRILFKKGLPLQLIYFVTSRCDSNCKHCFLQGKLNKDTNYLKFDELEKLAKTFSPLLSLSLTGGEPFMREDLPRIVDIFYNNSGFKNLAIITNGLATDRIVSFLDRILRDCPKANVFIGLSFDGLEDTHNAIRGVKDAFTKTKKTFFELKKLKTRYKNLSVGTCTTCSVYNQHELCKLYDFLLDLVPDGIGINLVRGLNWKDYANGIDIENYKLFALRKMEDYKKKIIMHPNMRYNKLLHIKEKMQYDFIARTYTERKYIAPCYAGRLLAIMKEEGNVYPCEMIQQSMGNIRDFNYNFKELWFSSTAQDIRAYIKKSRCFCTYECAMTSNIFYNPKYIIALLKGLFGYIR